MIFKISNYKNSVLRAQVKLKRGIFRSDISFELRQPQCKFECLEEFYNGPEGTKMVS